MSEIRIHHPGKCGDERCDQTAAFRAWFRGCEGKQCDGHLLCAVHAATPHVTEREVVSAVKEHAAAIIAVYRKTAL